MGCVPKHVTGNSPHLEGFLEGSFRFQFGSSDCTRSGTADKWLACLTPLGKSLKNCLNVVELDVTCCSITLFIVFASFLRLWSTFHIPLLANTHLFLHDQVYHSLLARIGFFAHLLMFEILLFDVVKEWVKKIRF
jgi:hypothetical protein